MRRNTHRALLAIAICAGIAAALGVVYLALVPQSPEEAYRRFVDPERQVAEDQIMDPLILAGKDVVPIVLRQVENAHMPRRRYAIGFLGNVGAIEALPALKRILTNKAERDYIRGDALRAVAMIDLDQGKTLAQGYASDEEYMGYIAKMIIAEDADLLQRRSYSDALLSRHDN